MFHLARRAPALLLGGLLLTGCSHAPAPAYRAETFKAESPFVTWSQRDPAAACEVGRRALLSQGYQVDSTNPTRIRGDKHFLPQPSYSMTLGITLECLPSNLGTAMYANALQTRYELKSAATSAGVGVAGIGSISLPWTADKEAMVKTGEETIADPDFYHRLFALIESMLGE
ncbi:DUF2242 domain-containing protein [Azoarcus sp. KH32C]|uniref:DUF2242 domain-containing protein n=1 Tax=Azoarcus sp. KH32C TaxID=748247 RepID=UPI0002385E75|nr:DUF2242 domain-containing protein [Azoarcus sp. KH32C]BAL22892.1 hypothetical protein AZKH_0546 [Azoarcus sp. KH32C]